jgi:hydroxymethylglutaryl-CoA lyase
MQDLKLIECPRDAMQGIHDFIPTELKTKYINSILECGFDTVDFGSFVSPKAIPQLRDTAEVLAGLDGSDSKLLAIVANERGAVDACNFEEISFLGYPFSVSEEFQKRNTNATIDESFTRVETIQELAINHDKELVLYLSMGFGNPYGEDWHPDIVANWCEKLYSKLDIKIQALSDTIGVGKPETISALFETLSSSLSDVEFGAHLHTRPETAKLMTAAAYEAGCRRFDGAVRGFGGCPMAADDLIGNMPTEKMLEWFSENEIPSRIDNLKFEEVMKEALTIFP